MSQKSSVIQIANLVPWVLTPDTYGTKRVIRITEDFWLIVTPRRVKMSQKSSAPPTRVPAEKLVRDIRHATRKHHSAQNKIRIFLRGVG
jgi:hypothetical protein